MTRHRPARVAGTLLLVALLLSSCARTSLWTPPGTGTFGTAMVTRDGNDTYTTTISGDVIRTVAASGNVDSNSRLFIWPQGVARVTDSESCATWTRTGASLVQQGAVFRVTRDGARVRAVTITQNIFFGAYWTFNVHTWDTARTGSPFRLEGQIDLRRWAEGRPLPWRVCGRVLGNLVQVKVWSPGEGEPEWDRPAQSGTVVLPDGWYQAGQTGWYAGHLAAGEFAQLSQVGTWAYGAEEARTRAAGESLDSVLVAD